MRTRTFKFLLLITALATPRPLLASGQAATESITVVRVDGSKADLTPAMIGKLPRVKASPTAHGQTTAYEGVDLRAVLLAVSAGPIDSLRGPALKRVVSVFASDGYRVVFALSELDQTLGSKTILLADVADGKKLGPTDGPWRLVVVGDSRPARSVRMVTRIEISELK